MSPTILRIHWVWHLLQEIILAAWPLYDRDTECSTELRPEFLNISFINSSLILTEKTYVLSVKPIEGQRGPTTGSSLSTSVFLCWYNSTTALYLSQSSC